MIWNFYYWLLEQLKTSEKNLSLYKDGVLKEPSYAFYKIDAYRNTKKTQTLAEKVIVLVSSENRRRSFLNP